MITFVMLKKKKKDTKKHSCIIICVMFLRIFPSEFLKSVFPILRGDNLLDF